MRFTNSLLSVHLSQTHMLDLFAIDGSSFVCQIKSDSFVVCARPRKPSEVKNSFWLVVLGIRTTQMWVYMATGFEEAIGRLSLSFDLGFRCFRSM